MPRGGPRPGAGRPKKVKVEQPGDAAAPVGAKKYQRRSPPPTTDADGFKKENTPSTWPFGKERPAAPAPQEGAKEDLSDLMPLDYLLSVMRNTDLPEPMRIQAATLSAQYCHAKPAPKSAKQEAEAERKKTAQSGRFGRRQPPTLTAVQGGKS